MDRPNILFIFPDQWRADCIGAEGHIVRTPYLDHLASQGTLFSSAYSPCPTCIATRASLMTGQRPITHGRLGYRDWIPWTYPNMLPQVLRDAGYETMCSGKTHFAPQRARCGFEKMELYDNQKHDPWFESDYEQWLREKSRGLHRDTAQDMSSNSWIAKPWTAPEELHPNAWTTDMAIEMMRKRDPLRPFFLQVSYHRPHPPLDPPLHLYEEYRDLELPPVAVGDWAARHDVPVNNADGHSIGRLDDRQLRDMRCAYYAQLTHLDQQIGRLFRYMKQNALWGNTWIVFSSDHGELLGDHHLFRKTVPWEGAARVPLIIRPPQGTEQRRCDKPLTHADYMPTFLGIAGVDIPETVEGRSLLPFVRGEKPDWRDYVHGEHSPRRQFVTDGKAKYAWDSITGEQWFFDLEHDPQELHNAAHDLDRREDVAMWRQRLVDELQGREQVEDGDLKNNRPTPAVLDWLLEQPS